MVEVVLVAEARQVLLVAFEKAEKSLGDGAAARAFHQQMLRAEALRRFGQHRRAAVTGQQIAADPERRVGGDPRERIGSAAVQAHHEFSGRNLRALPGGGFREQRRDRVARRRDGLRRPAGFLQRQALQPDALRPALAEVIADLIRLAAQADQDGAGDIRVRHHARDRAAQFSRIGVAAAVAVREADHAVDARRQRVVFITAGDQFHGMRGAVAGGDHGDVVARAGAAVRAQVAAKRGSAGRGIRHGQLPGGKLEVARRLIVVDVVCVQVLPGGDRLPRPADFVTVAADDLAGGERRQGDLVSRGDLRAGLRVPAIERQAKTGRKRHARHAGVVGRVEAKHGVGGGRRSGDPDERHLAGQGSTVPLALRFCAIPLR